MSQFTTKKYLKDHDLPLSPIEGLMGVVDSDQLDQRNWLPMRTVLEEFFKIKIRYYSSVELKIGIWDDVPTEDGLFFLDYESHCYVLLYYKEKNLALISDGGDTYHRDVEISSELNKLLRIRLISCSFKQQTRIDHCTSSALLIGLELLRAYKSQLRPFNLFAPKELRTYVRQRLHKYTSVASMSGMQLHELKSTNSCSRCGRRFAHSTIMKKHESKCRAN